MVGLLQQLFKTVQQNQEHPDTVSESSNYKTAFNQTRAPEFHGSACYAPFKNMYFGQQGKVHACCYNRRHVLGTYPAQSILQIWQSDKANQLRKQLKQFSFSLGCFSCAEQLMAGNFDGTKARQYDNHRLNDNGYPSVMEFELDNTCNLECMMCSGEFSSLIRTKREGRAELPKHYDDEFIRQLEAFIPYLEDARFYGGEPFLVPIYYKIWDKMIALNPGLHITVQTNGTTLNNRVKEILQQSNFHINLSLDSLDKDRYEKIRKNADFDTVMRNLEFFHSYCKERNTSFYISTCLLQNNWFEAPDFIRFCNDLNVTIYFHTVTNPGFLSLKQFSNQKLEEVYTDLANQLEGLQDDTPVRKKNKKHYHDFILQIKEWSNKPEADTETKDIHSPEQLLAFLLKKTDERSDIDEAAKKASADSITYSINNLAKLLPAGLSINGMIKDWNIKDKSQLIAGLEAAEKLNAEDEITKLKMQHGGWIQQV